MNNKFILYLAVIALNLILLNCSKAEEEEGPAEDLVFQSLVTEKDTIAPSENTKITAIATGSQLEYFWSKDAGEISPTDKPSEIYFSAGPCEIGERTVTCEITNGSTQSETKSIIIVVL